VIEKKAAAEFLNALNNAIRDRGVGLPVTIRLPTFEPAGFAPSAGDRAARPEADEPHQYALFRDGLARIGEPFRGRSRNGVVWCQVGGWRLIDAAAARR
jgi:hypothetical protein